MFDPVTSRLLQTAPALEGLDPETLPALLTRHYAELVAQRLRGVTGEASAESEEQDEWPLAKIADAYEIVASIHEDREIRRSAAFVAATANQILSRQLSLPQPTRIPYLTAIVSRHQWRRRFLFLPPNSTRTLLRLLPQSSPKAVDKAMPQQSFANRSAIWPEVSFAESSNAQRGGAIPDSTEAIWMTAR
jgi:hypothetical protein